nr:hypothetical protein [uncultured Duganella sp.]
MLVLMVSMASVINAGVARLDTVDGFDWVHPSSLAASHSVRQNELIEEQGRPDGAVSLANRKKHFIKKTTTEKLDLSYALLLRYIFHVEIIGETLLL